MYNTPQCPLTDEILSSLLVATTVLEFGTIANPSSRFTVNTQRISIWDIIYIYLYL